MGESGCYALQTGNDAQVTCVYRRPNDSRVAMVGASLYTFEDEVVESASDEVEGNETEGTHLPELVG